MENDENDSKDGYGRGIPLTAVLQNQKWDLGLLFMQYTCTYTKKTTSIA